jgi:galactofuranosylgalactofuranosylrhamnosyl-N-acetylglucosaminyl-diphospho-decaprenol beta-1,5/1,6-galactofuranosyltransferase
MQSSQDKTMQVSKSKKNQEDFTCLDNIAFPEKENLVQELAFPDPKICTSSELYLHTTSDCIVDTDSKVVFLRRNGILDLGTYFNSFSIDKWKKYTCLSKISILLRIKGKFKLDVYTFVSYSGAQNTGLGTRNTVFQRQLQSISLGEYTEAIIDLDISNLSGLLCFRLEALSEHCCFSGGVYTSSQSPINNISLALVTCTYKRELMVQKTALSIEKCFSAGLSSRNQPELFIIDNGNTLEKFTESPNVHIIPNKNSGGSGGFARGMIEVLDKEKFSHLILMDDDIVVDPISISRVISFLEYSQNTELPIAGTMIKLEEQYRLHESGASVDFFRGFVPMKQGLDLRDLTAVASSDIEEYVMFGGWWFYCVSTQQLANNGMPYPFFLRLDDAEYGMRLSQTTITLNGCCVWHESFLAKEKPATVYYYTRNLLIVLSKYFRDVKTLDVIKLITRDTIRNLFMYRYENAKFILRGVKDFLDGPDGMKNRDPEVNNKELMSSQREVSCNKYQDVFIASKYNESINQTESKIHRLFRILSFNGHFLPDFLLKPASSPLSSGFRILPILPSRPLNLFRSKKALYYDIPTRTGYMVAFSRVECFQILLNLVTTMFMLVLRFPKLRKEYARSFDELTTINFWKEYLNLEVQSSRLED